MLSEVLVVQVVVRVEVLVVVVALVVVVVVLVVVVQVMVEVPLFDRNQGTIRSARADIANSRANLRTIELDLATQTAQAVAAYPPGALPVQEAADLAASFQEAVADVMADRARHAMAIFRRTHPATALVVAGGVAANATLRQALATAAERAGFRFVAPPLRLCTDNAVMVAWAGLERLRHGWTDALNHAPRPRWPLDSSDMRPA